MKRSDSTASPRLVRTAGALTTIGIATVLLFATIGCGSSESDDATGSTATTYPEGQCISRTPGQVLTAEEAVVRFSPTEVCPGYVTILPGTPVTFANRDSTAHTITITEGTLPGGSVVFTGVAEPGGTWVQPFESVGVFSYTTDALPAFRGTIEVTDGTTSH